MGVSVLTGRAARPGGDPALAGWRDLAEACPWSTPYGCPDLAQAWYEAHEAIFEPVVLYEQGADGQLEGLLALARHLTSGEIVPAVHRDASVYGWLARPLRGSYFLERALEAFGEHFPKQNLELEALPDGAPIDWAGPGRRLGRWARVESAHHWRMRFDPERAKKKLDKRANSQQVSGLKRRGEMRFERRLDAPTLERWLPDFARWFDAFAVDTGLSPRFEDHPEELTFWRRLTDGSESFSASVLWIDDTPSAAVLGFRIRDRFHVAWGVDNPAFETQGPSQVLWLLLEEALLGEGLVDADVTCGFPWMRLGASEAKDTVKVSVLFDTMSRARYDLGQSALRASQVALKLIER